MQKAFDVAKIIAILTAVIGALGLVLTFFQVGDFGLMAIATLVYGIVQLIINAVVKKAVNAFLEFRKLPTVK